MGSWYGICAGAWFISWCLAEVIPNFNLFLGLIGSLFGSWFSCEYFVLNTTRFSDADWLTCVVALPPMLWLYQHRSNWWSTRRKITLTIINFVVVMLGVTIVSNCLPSNVHRQESMTNMYAVWPGYMVIRYRACERYGWKGFLVCE
jgi:hypothetical protein